MTTPVRRLLLDHLMGAVLALIAAVSYGVGDFVGGVGGRRSVPGLIPLAIQVVGVLFAAAAVGFGVGTAPTTTVLVWGAVSGIGSGIGNAALFRGLSGGQMSVVAPLSAVVTAALPALVGLVSGDRRLGGASSGSPSLCPPWPSRPGQVAPTGSG